MRFYSFFWVPVEGLDGNDSRTHLVGSGLSLWVALILLVSVSHSFTLSFYNHVESSYFISFISLLPFIVLICFVFLFSYQQRRGDNCFLKFSLTKVTKGGKSSNKSQMSFCLFFYFTVS